MTFVRTTPSWCLARMLFMNLPLPRDLSYTRSASSGTSMPAEPADGEASDQEFPIAYTFSGNYCLTLGAMR